MKGESHSGYYGQSGFNSTGLLAYQGKEGCEDARCTRWWKPGQIPGPCMGWHCPRCHQPCSSQGHSKCPEVKP